MLEDDPAPSRIEYDLNLLRYYDLHLAGVLVRHQLLPLDPTDKQIAFSPDGDHGFPEVSRAAAGAIMKGARQSDSPLSGIRFVSRGISVRG